MHAGGQDLPLALNITSGAAVRQACSTVAVDDAESYWVPPLPEYPGTLNNYGLCAAFRPCNDTFDAVLGVGQCARHPAPRICYLPCTLQTHWHLLPKALYKTAFVASCVPGASLDGMQCMRL